MKEYWVNVYKADEYERIRWGKKQSFYVKDSREDALRDAAYRNLLYRIHVKMKDNKPKYEEALIPEDCDSWKYVNQNYTQCYGRMDRTK